jgi:aerobic-type carbon monoxide dehydrogenase small subunit (CoxS/CutS family)
MQENQPPKPQDLPPSPGARSNTGISRRSFLKGAGLTAAGTALLDGVQEIQHEAFASNPETIKEYSAAGTEITLHINGQAHALQVEPRTTLADALRIGLGMTGTKIGCDRGVCSSCTVWLDKVPVNSCMTLAIDGIGHKITTIEGLSNDTEVHPVQAAFVKHDAMQCGFCTPGMVMSCAALLERNSHPTETDVRIAVSGNYCRCGTYPKVFAATLDAATRNA